MRGKKCSMLLRKRCKGQHRHRKCYRGPPRRTIALEIRSVREIVSTTIAMAEDCGVDISKAVTHLAKKQGQQVVFVRKQSKEELVHSSFAF